MKNKAISERRREKRFPMKEEASFVLTPSCKGLGEIVDISKSGMAFQYVGEGEWTTEEEELGILFGDHDSCLDEVLIRTVSDRVVEEMSAGQKMVVRRRSVEFSGLSEEQLFLLDCFIWINAVSDQ